MIFNVHAGHATVGGGAIGAVGLINESIEDRAVKDVVISYLQNAGHTVYDCTCDYGNQNEILNGIVSKCNSHDVDLDVSIHFNSGAGDMEGNGSSCGTEVYIYDDGTREEAQRVVDKIASLGFRNRGVKINKSLMVLNSTKARALLIECCFVDDKDDVNLYNAESMGKAIAEALLNTTIDNTPVNTTTATKSEDEIVDDIIAGKYGNGEARKEAITNMGYDYNYIQSLVNARFDVDSTPATPTIEVGCDVLINDEARTYDGQYLAQWAYDRTYVVSQINDDRVVITYEGTVVAAMNINDLRRA